jgi:hypothetical protein
MPFAVSISILGLAQALLVALPRPRVSPAWMPGGRWWAAVPAGSIVVVLAVVELAPDSATALAWLALVAVPPLAALALGWIVRGSKAWWAALAIPLFAIAWSAQGSMAGESAAAALSGLSCIALGWMLVALAPVGWLKLGIYAMAAVDTWLVAADLLQGPNAVLTVAAPGGLPSLQAIHLGSAQMGFGDFFVAATLGCLLASDRHSQRLGALLVAAFALGFDLLFLLADTLPATVPVALALAVIEMRGRAAERRRSDAGDARDGKDEREARGCEGDFPPRGVRMRLR